MGTISRGSVLWLRITAVAILAFNFTLYFALGGGAPILPVITLIAVAILIWISMGPARRQRFLEHAVYGKATITGVSTTGTMINNVPVLEYELSVQGPTGGPYSTHDRVTAFPGTVPNRGTFQCAIDPKRPKKVAILLDKPVGDHTAVREETVTGSDVGSDIDAAIARVIAQAAGPGASVRTSSRVVFDDSAGGAETIADPLRAHAATMRNVSAAELLASGQRMTSVVRQFSPIGKTVGDVTPGAPDGSDPLYLFKLEIPLEGGSPIEAVCVHRVPAGKVDGLRLGERLNVAVNPANPTREVAIDWQTSPIN